MGYDPSSDGRGRPTLVDCLIFVVIAIIFVLGLLAITWARFEEF